LAAVFQLTEVVLVVQPLELAAVFQLAEQKQVSIYCTLEQLLLFDYFVPNFYLVCSSV
jgi:hypothetical protein